MSIFTWIGRQFGLTGQRWAFMEENTYAGKPVNADTAMTVGAFWAGVRLISQTTGTLPLGLYRRRADNGRDVAADHPLYGILHDMPNADQTACEFWESAVGSLCIWGNAYAEKVMSGKNLTALQQLSSCSAAVERTKEGALQYTFDDRGKRVKLPESKVFHIRGFGIGGDVGLSPLAFARQTLGSALATEEAAARVFANGMRPQGFFTVEKVLTQEQRAQAKSVLIDPYQGSQNAGKSGILEAGFKWQDVQMPAEDAQLLQSRQFSVEEVCRWLGIPPILVGHASAGQTMWGSGVEQIMLGWLTLGLRPYLARIEQSIKRSLLAPSERKVLYPEFTVEGLLRADSAGRANLYSTFAQNGIMTRNEIRALENLPSEEGGDVLTVQVNLQNISNLAEGASPQPKPQPAEEDGNVTPFPNRRSGGGRN
jgi:HK97 family phage portal protein